MTDHDRSGTTTEATEEDPLGAFGAILAGVVDGILSALDDEGVDLSPIEGPEVGPVTDEWEFVLTFEEAVALTTENHPDAPSVRAELAGHVIDCLLEVNALLEDAA